MHLVLSRTQKIITVVILVLLTIIIIGIRLRSRQSGYVFEAVKKTSVSEIVSDSGKVSADGKADVRSPTNGIIEEVYVTNGQTVKENDQLFKVKSSASLQERQTAFSSYQAALAAQKAAETLLHSYRSAMYTKWKTYTDLATSSTYESSPGVANINARNTVEFQTAKENWLAAEKLLIDQEQALSAAKAGTNAAWTAYQATQTSVVTAPLGGIVNNLAVGVGNSVSAQTVLNPTASPVLTIVNSPSVEAVLDIGQTDIAKVKVGQSVNIHPDAYKDQEFAGKVVRVDSLGQDIAGVITYRVYIGLSGNTDNLRSGMTVDGDIITNSVDNVLTVPNSAIVLYQGGKAVRISGNNNSLRYLPVTVGLKGETRTQILSGISEGQQIVVALTNEKAARPSFMGL